MAKNNRNQTVHMLRKYEETFRQRKLQFFMAVNMSGYLGLTNEYSAETDRWVPLNSLQDFIQCKRTPKGLRRLNLPGGNIFTKYLYCLSETLALKKFRPAEVCF